jgi:RNase P subunit RPR2
MRIIKEGKLPEEILKRLTCSHCHTEFEFAMKEAKYNSDQRDGDYYTIPCPLCCRTITFNHPSRNNYNWMDR